MSKIPRIRKERPYPNCPTPPRPLFMTHEVLGSPVPTVTTLLLYCLTQGIPYSRPTSFTDPKNVIHFNELVGNGTDEVLIDEPTQIRLRSRHCEDKICRIEINIQLKRKTCFRMKRLSFPIWLCSGNTFLRYVT